MRALATLAALCAAVACSSEKEPSSSFPDASAGGETGAPDAGPPITGDSGEAQYPVPIAPTCGRPGDRVVLRLSKNNLPPICVRTADFAVQFASAQLVQPDRASVSSEGYCVVELPVPPSTTTGIVTVKSAGDTYVSSEAFTVPCR